MKVQKKSICLKWNLCNIWKVFTVIFDIINAFLLNKSINVFQKNRKNILTDHRILNGSVYKSHLLYLKLNWCNLNNMSEEICIMMSKSQNSLLVFVHRWRTPSQLHTWSYPSRVEDQITVTQRTRRNCS